MNKTGFLRAIDKVVLVVLGAVLFVNGLYLVGPWYLNTTPVGGTAPLYFLLQDKVAAVGFLHLVTGLLLIVAPLWGRMGRWLDWVILAGFLTRLYSLIGVIAVSDFLPPNYISHVATVIVLGAYWLWVRYVSRY